MSHRARYRESITHSPRIGQNSLGPVYGDSAACKGYAEPGFRRIVSSTGTEAIASLYIELGPDLEDRLGVGDKVEWKGTEYVVLSVQPIRPRAKTDHLEVYCGPFGESG